MAPRSTSVPEAATLTTVKPRETKCNFAAWKAETKAFLVCGMALILYGTYNWQILRESSHKLKRDSWNWQAIVELLTVGVSVVVVLLAAAILESRLGEHLHWFPRQFSQTVGKNYFSTAETKDMSKLDTGRHDLINETGCVFGETSTVQDDSDSSHSTVQEDANSSHSAIPQRLCPCDLERRTLNDLSCISLRSIATKNIDSNLESSSLPFSAKSSDAMLDTNTHLTVDNITAFITESGAVLAETIGNRGVLYDNVSWGKKSSGCIDGLGLGHGGELLLQQQPKRVGTGLDWNPKGVERQSQLVQAFAHPEKIDRLSPNSEDLTIHSTTCIEGTVGTLETEIHTAVPNNSDVTPCPSDCPKPHYIQPAKRDQSTQTDVPQTRGGLTRPGTSSRCTMTETYTVDASVSTHVGPCRLVRHCSTSTSGPFMKKLRRAQRLLSEAKETSRLEQREGIAKWRRALDKYKHKRESLTQLLGKKDQMLGCTSSRIAVIQREIKEALVAVRSSTSTKERLNTQCKLNAALMDVIESKSENPTYSAGLTDHGTGINQEQRGP